MAIPVVEFHVGGYKIDDKIRAHFYWINFFKHKLYEYIVPIIKIVLFVRKSTQNF